MKINDLEFDIKSIDITKESIPINFGFHQKMISGRSEIRINAQTSNSNYFKIDKWFNDPDYKKDATFNGVQIFGIFPKDYTFNQNVIEVTFSADYINGDLNLFNKQYLRKEKLKRIQKINGE